MVKVAGVQLQATPDKQQNIANASVLVKIARENGAQIICFPELFTLPWFPQKIDRNYFSLAETISGETISQMQQLAAAEEVVIICPLFEKGEHNHYYNTVVVINYDGNLLGKYRKVHLPDIHLWREQFYFTPGDLGFPIFSSRGLTFGVLICWDVFFPEAFRVLTLKGASLVFCPTASAHSSQARWKTVICANAINNGFYIFRVNRIGQEQQQFYGDSFCANPYGDIICEANATNNSIVLAEIDLQLMATVRKNWPFLSERRPMFYQEITKTPPIQTVKAKASPDPIPRPHNELTDGC